MASINKSNIKTLKIIRELETKERKLLLIRFLVFMEKLLKARYRLNL